MLTASTNFAVHQSSPEPNSIDSFPEIFLANNDLVRDRISLTQWFQYIFSPQWQDVINSDRRVIAIRGSVSNYEISKTIEKLKLSDDESYRHHLIQKLGFIGDGDCDAVQALVELIQTTQNDETLWIAVESLRQAAPTHPCVGIRKSKSIDLCHSANFNFIVNLVPKLDNRFGVLLQVYPDTSRLYLPNSLKLILQDEAGNTLREIVSADQDYCIQLKLSGTYREIFSVCLELDGIVSIVDFVV